MLKLIWKILLPGAAILLLAGTAFAGGVVVTLEGDVPVVTAGTPFTVQFTIRSAHDGSPQDKFHPSVIAVNPATGERVRVDGTSEGEAGRYSATLTLPSSGTWNWQILPDKSYPDDSIGVMTPIQVQAAGAAAQAAPAARPALMPGLVWVGVLLAALLGLLGAIGLRRRQEARA